MHEVGCLVLTCFLAAYMRQVRDAGDLSDEWYWISQLYDEDWKPDDPI